MIPPAYSWSAPWSHCSWMSLEYFPGEVYRRQCYNDFSHDCIKATNNRNFLHTWDTGMSYGVTCECERLHESYQKNKVQITPRHDNVMQLVYGCAWTPPWERYTRTGSFCTPACLVKYRCPLSCLGPLFCLTVLYCSQVTPLWLKLRKQAVPSVSANLCCGVSQSNQILQALCSLPWRLHTEPTDDWALCWLLRV